MSDRPQHIPDRTDAWPKLTMPVPLPADPVERLMIEHDLDQWWAQKSVAEKLSIHARIAMGLPYDLVE